MAMAIAPMGPCGRLGSLQRARSSAACRLSVGHARVDEGREARVVRIAAAGWVRLLLVLPVLVRCVCVLAVLPLCLCVVAVSYRVSPPRGPVVDEMRRGY